MKESRFIVFEGVDGCGKTTQAKLLADKFKELESRQEVVLTHEPGGTALGLKIRDLLLKSSGLTPQIDSPSLYSELLLFMASRAELVTKKIRPALSRGAVVICDRYTDSSLAYQGYGFSLDKGQIRQLNYISCQGLFPDITFWLDVDVETALERKGKIRDRVESMGLAFHKRVAEGYRQIWLGNATDNGKIIRVDGSPESSTVFKEVIGVLSHRTCGMI